MALMKSVEQAYRGFTPQHEDHGSFGNLHVYTMNNIGGISMYLARTFLQKNNYKLLRNTIDSYARFFASAYHNTPGPMGRPDRGLLLQSYTWQLQRLREGLPERFYATLDTLIPQLPSIFDQDWPLVPNHTDLLENNIHVDPGTGAIVGICDWRDAEISPFGMSLGGLETMLGVRTMNEHGWSYFPNHNELREHFWTTFYQNLGATSEAQQQRIEVARLTGLFLANGFVQDQYGNMHPATEESLDLRYLGAVVLA
ncbi:phosphotransferase enzyme family domain-containing protein [Hirsutella rhossiliensis]|uniref:Phosphotransferase enzyme family domain-containing protein n=1 Tax=Hirsutella rhossiliensis TaxID=111463 RepID=A0A9P8MU38_9HYPO|nr:phosphotransferase enzyme family domain-containing protein [Hirsutella rhossiliensis]KAH0961194.1 phosphotransferase enzyme family domain-containing protein [Hirsutella rhossiliensis]